MAKNKTVYVCSNCGADSPKWQGRCPSCGEWNTFVEEVVPQTSSSSSRHLSFSPEQKNRISLQALRDIQAEDEPRIDMLDAELNRVLGGGLVKGSLVLIGGEPGIGKSTLVLQTILKLKALKVLYVSGEESYKQLKLRADRLAGTDSDCQILCETNLEQILLQAS